jgi:hypothetical protein
MQDGRLKAKIWLTKAIFETKVKKFTISQKIRAFMCIRKQKIQGTRIRRGRGGLEKAKRLREVQARERQMHSKALRADWVHDLGTEQGGLVEATLIIGETRDVMRRWSAR